MSFLALQRVLSFFLFFFKCHIWVCSHFWLCSGFFLFRFILVRGFFNVVRSFFKHFADTITVTVTVLTYFIDKPLFYCIYFFLTNLITPFGEKHPMTNLITPFGKKFYFIFWVSLGRKKQ